MQPSGLLANIITCIKKCFCLRLPPVYLNSILLASHMYCGRSNEVYHMSFDRSFALTATYIVACSSRTSVSPFFASYKDSTVCLQDEIIPPFSKHLQCHHQAPSLLWILTPVPAAVSNWKCGPKLCWKS